MNEWSATVEYAVADMTAELMQAITKGIDGFSGVAHDSSTGRARIGLSVTESTLRQATDAALRVTRAALANAGVKGEPVSVHVLTAEDLQREIEKPTFPKFAGVAEAAEILGVSRQRVGELEATHPDFPPVIQRLKSGPVFVREHIEGFSQRWVRRTGRPKKTA